MRALSVSNDSLAIGVRQLEALARLATAHAKILFKDKVEVSDVLIVEELLKRMFGSLGVNTDNKFSQATFVVGKKENKEENPVVGKAYSLHTQGEVLSHFGFPSGIKFIDFQVVASGQFRQHA